MVLVILLVRGATLEGARDGIEYYIGTQSNITKLMEGEVRLRGGSECIEYLLAGNYTISKPIKACM